MLEAGSAFKDTFDATNLISYPTLRRSRRWLPIIPRTADDKADCDAPQHSSSAFGRDLQDVWDFAPADDTNCLYAAGLTRGPCRRLLPTLLLLLTDTGP